MQFPNALEGVKKIHKAEILDLIAGIVALIASVIAIVSMSAGGEDTGIGGLLSAGVLLIVVAVLSIIAFIMNITGLNKGKLDEVNFKNALYAVLVGIIASIVLGAAKEGSLLKDLGETVSSICRFLCTWYVCTAVISLADRMGDAEMSAKALKARKMLMTVWILSIVLEVISVLLGALGASDVLNVVSAILGLVAIVVSIIAYILYLKMLSASRTMLQR